MLLTSNPLKTTEVVLHAEGQGKLIRTCFCRCAYPTENNYIFFIIVDLSLRKDQGLQKTDAMSKINPGFDLYQHCSYEYKQLLQAI